MNFGVAVAKSAWGVISGSGAMLADGIHSLSDGSSNVIGLFGMHFASKPVDEDHPYGHEKYQTFAGAFIGVMLVIAAIRIAISSVEKMIIYYQTGILPVVEVTAVSFVIMVTTLLINISVVWWERKKGIELKSEILTADAQNTFSDIFVTSGVIVGLIFTKYHPVADAVTSIFVAVAVFIAAISVFRMADRTLSDRYRIPPETIRQYALSVKGVLGCHHIRNRGSGSKVFVDLSIQVDAQMTVKHAHDIAVEVEKLLCSSIPEVADAVVHVEPYDEYQRAKTS